jgi:hypothetical protein
MGWGSKESIHEQCNASWPLAASNVEKARVNVQRRLKDAIVRRAASRARRRMLLDCIGDAQDVAERVLRAARELLGALREEASQVRTEGFGIPSHSTPARNSRRLGAGVEDVDSGTEPRRAIGCNP